MTTYIIIYIKFVVIFVILSVGNNCNYKCISFKDYPAILNKF